MFSFCFAFGDCVAAKGSLQDLKLAAQRQAQKQQERLEKLANQLGMKKRMEEERQRVKEEKQVAIKKKFEDERQRMKEERERLREEKEKERQKKLEEKKKKMEQEREWNRPREDMECDDLKPLPELKELKMRIPTHLFGDTLMILEYVNAFKSMFDFEQFFPKGLTWDHMLSAVMEADQQGPMCDLLQMLLCAVFTLQEAEAGEVQAEDTEGILEEYDKKAPASHTDEENGEEDDHVSRNELIRSAILSAQFSQLTFGVPLKDTTLDQYTLTEILRLHLMSSGADANQRNARFRYQQRGGYCALDDPGFELRKQESALMKKLQTGNVFDLGPEEKLRLLMTLVQQVMTYAAVRDILEDSYDKLRVRKYDLKIMQWAEVRRVRETLAEMYRRNMEEKVRDHEYRLKEMARAVKIKQSVDSGLEPPAFPPLEDPRLTAEQKQQREEQERAAEAKKKEEFEQKDLDAQREIMDLQKTNALYPLGRDRLYRRYWYFSSLPAVLVEDHELFLPYDPATEGRVTPSVKPAGVSGVGVEKEKRVNGDSSREESPMTNGDSIDGSSSASNGVTDTAQSRTNAAGSVSECAMDATQSHQDDSVSSDAVDSKQSQRLKEEKVSDSANAEDTEQESQSSEQTCPDDADTKDSEPSSQQQTNGDRVKTENPEKAGEEVSDPQQTKPSQEGTGSGSSEARETERSQKEPRWYLVDSRQCLQQLMSALNPRGFRESALQTMLQDYQRLLHQTIDSCPLDKLCKLPADAEEKAAGKSPAPSNTPTSRKVVGSTQSDSVSEVMELNLRDGLLEMEGRIYAGGLGAIKVKDRTAWRDALERGGYSPYSDEAPFARVHSPKKSKADSKAGSSAKQIPEEVVAKDLAHALVQVIQGVDPRYLKPPYGESDRRSLNSKEEKQADAQRRAIYERWEESALGSRSLSQVFLHLTALDKCIKWNRSTLKLRCRVCRRMRDDDKMLLCDKCDRGHHIYCLKPPLTKIPSGDWFCHTCRRKVSAPAPRKRRKNFDADEEEREESMEFENDLEGASDDGEEDEDMEDSEQEDDIPNEDVCATCREDGVLILCDVCPRSFHLDCAQPPLKKVPKGKWMCHVCVDGGSLGKSKGKGKQGSAKKGTPGSKSRLSGSRQQTPRNSPTPTSGRRKQGASQDSAGKGSKGRSTPRDQSQKASKQNSADKSTPKGWSNGKGLKRKSQLSDAEDPETEEDWLQAADTLLTNLMDHGEAWPFLEPVDKKVAPDYYVVIESPMDFSTIRSKLDRNGYSSSGQFLDDVQLIFTNCVQYNLSSAPVYQAGQALSKFFQSRASALGLHPQEKSSPSPSSASKKQRR
ncbi:hypothetical protein ACOMHN_042632 [Nucella lapillus]